jgi:hypothetical protein
MAIRDSPDDKVDNSVELEAELFAVFCSIPDTEQKAKGYQHSIPVDGHAENIKGGRGGYLKAVPEHGKSNYSVGYACHIAGSFL